MRVPDLLLKSIGFVAEVLGPDETSASLDPVATAFLVSVSSSGLYPIRGRFYYAVTAKHVIEKATPNTETVLIVNKKGGGVKPLDLRAGWVALPDADVAVAPVGTKDTEVDVSAFDVEDFFDESNNPENIGPGDEVFFPGLFTVAPGIEKIIPLTRHGNLAMLPGQPIQTSNGYEDLYLIEARSIGGLSGSPVFARETIVLPVERPNKEKTMMQGVGKFKLLGLIQGHWDVDESKINQAYIEHSPKRGVNLGIAKVVPAKKILELLNIPDLLEFRKYAERKANEEHSSMGGSEDGIS